MLGGKAVIDCDDAPGRIGEMAAEAVMGVEIDDNPAAAMEVNEGGKDFAGGALSRRGRAVTGRPHRSAPAPRARESRQPAADRVPAPYGPRETIRAPRARSASRREGVRIVA